MFEGPMSVSLHLMPCQPTIAMIHFSRVRTPNSAGHTRIQNPQDISQQQFPASQLEREFQISVHQVANNPVLAAVSHWPPDPPISSFQRLLTQQRLQPRRLRLRQWSLCCCCQRQRPTMRRQTRGPPQAQVWQQLQWAWAVTPAAAGKTSVSQQVPTSHTAKGCVFEYV